MKISELLKNKSDVNNSKIMRKLIEITDMNSKVKGNYKIEWKITRIKRSPTKRIRW